MFGGTIEELQQARELVDGLCAGGDFQNVGATVLAESISCISVLSFGVASKLWTEMIRRTSIDSACSRTERSIRTDWSSTSTYVAKDINLRSKSHLCLGES